MGLLGLPGGSRGGHDQYRACVRPHGHGFVFFQRFLALIPLSFQVHLPRQEGSPTAPSVPVMTLEMFKLMLTGDTTKSAAHRSH